MYSYIRRPHRVGMLDYPCVSHILFWSYLELSGAIWSYLEPPGEKPGLSVVMWYYLKLGTVFDYLELSGALWNYYLELFGASGAVWSS